MARIDTAGTMTGRPIVGGTRHNELTGRADYGNTSANWDPANTGKLGFDTGEDPAVEIVRWKSQSKYEGWMNTILGYSSGRYLWGAFISGCEFQWRTYPNESGGITLRRWGIGIAQRNGNQRARWSSAEVNEWSTSSSWKTIRYSFDGSLNSLLNNGWVVDELHFMVHTPRHGSTPSKGCHLEIKNFKFHYRNNDAIIPAMRRFDDRADYPIA